MKTNVLFETIYGRSLKDTMTLGQAIHVLSSHNLINIGELAEIAISKKSGVALCNRNMPEVDLVSGVQIKHAQTNPIRLAAACLHIFLSKELEHQFWQS